MSEEDEKLGVEVSIRSIDGAIANVKVVVASKMDVYQKRSLPGTEWEGAVPIERRWSIEKIEVEAMKALRRKMEEELHALMGRISDAEADLMRELPCTA